MSYAIQAELVGICKKEVQSDLHRDFIEGNIKEKRSLRMIEKFGPGAFLTDSKVRFAKSFFKAFLIFLHRKVNYLISF